MINSRFRQLIRAGVPPHQAAAGSLLWKKDVESPDYESVAEAAREANTTMAALGQEQLDFAKQQYSENKETFDAVSSAQIRAMDQQYTQGKDYYDYQVETFRPMEQGLVQDAADYNTEATQSRMASKAAADAGLAFGQVNSANERSMRSMGVNPNSGRAQALRSQSGLAQSASRANAMTGARTSAEQLGWAKRMDAVGLGRGLAGASTAAYGSATNAGNSGVQSGMAAGNQFTNAYSSGVNTIGQGQSMQLQGLTSAMNGQVSGMEAQMANSTLSQLGGLAGGAASMYSAMNPLPVP